MKIEIKNSHFLSKSASISIMFHRLHPHYTAIYIFSKQYKEFLRFNIQTFKIHHTCIIYTYILCYVTPCVY